MRILLLLTVLIAVSCSKDNEAGRDGNDPTVESVTFQPSYAGSNMSIKFTFTLKVPLAGSVKQAKLYKVPSKLVWSTDQPETGVHIMYDHSVDIFPTHASNTFYQLEFAMQDGTTKQTDKFQVY